MLDYDKLFEFGKDGEYVWTVCEVAKGSTLKVEFDRERKLFILDRVEPGIFAKPVNYGFIPQTTDEDGDALDTLIVMDEPIPMGLVTKARVVGMLDFSDDGETDHKIVCVPEDDRHAGPAIKDIDDLNEHWKKQVEHHFSHYKDLKKPGSTIVRGWGNAEQAWQVIANCVERYKSAS